MAMAPPPAPPAVAAIPASFDGIYAGSLTLTSSGLFQPRSQPHGLRVGPARSGPVRNGLIKPRIRQLEAAQLHYKGRSTAPAVTAYHKNSDGSSSVLNGQIANGQLTGNMDRGPCSYAVALAMR